MLFSAGASSFANTTMTSQRGAGEGGEVTNDSNDCFVVFSRALFFFRLARDNVEFMLQRKKEQKKKKKKDFG